MKQRFALSFIVITLAAMPVVRATDSAASVSDATVSIAASSADEIASRGPLQLSMKRAIQLATSKEGSPRVQLQWEALKQAKGRWQEVRSGFLPDVESYVGIGTSVRSLSALGLSNIISPAGISNPLVGELLNEFLPGGIPSRVGPFHTLDIRGTANMTALDFSLIERLHSAKASEKAAKEDINTTDDQVTGQVARAYLNALRSDADVEAAQADVDLSQAVVKQSTNQKEAGSGTGIDVTRSNVQLANDKQRLLVAKNNRTKAHLQLLRTMNLRLDTTVDLTDKLAFKPVDVMSVQDAVAQALANRPDLKAQLDREDAARQSAKAVKFERLPSIVTQFNYGVIGPQDIHLVPTRDYYGAVRIPIFDGGRRDARRAEAASQRRQEGIRSADLRDQIELDVRTSLDSLASANEQVEVATDGLKLSETELAQARRRFDAGVASSLEVTDASDKVQRARSNEIQAVFNHNLARIDLGQALGKTISMID